MGALHHLTDINGDTALHWAAYKGHAEIIQILINSGVDLQKTDNFGSTPLHLSCLSGNLICVRLLCQKQNLDLQPKDKNEKTPLMLAQSHRHYEIVKLLQNEMKVRQKLVKNWLNLNVLFLEKISMVPSVIRDLGMDFWGCWQLKRTFASVSCLRAYLGISDVHYQSNSHHLEQLEALALRFYLLEHSHVGFVSIEIFYQF